MPGHGQPRSSFTIADSVSLGAVTPSPDGSRVALTVSPCAALRGQTGLVVRDLSTGRRHALFTTGNPCDGFGDPVWNPAGTRIAFVFDRASGPPIPIAGGSACPAARDRLAIVASGRAFINAKPELIAPERGCVFKAATFDRGGIAAAEGCNRGSTRNEGGAHLGDAYLLQLTARGEITNRIALKRGLEDAVVARIPATGNVLITQDQPANEPYPERDWVWEFDATHLRPVAHYAAHDAAHVLAIPW